MAGLIGIVGAVGASLAASNAAAHETWILPAHGVAQTAPGWMPLAISSGMDFPRQGIGLPAERLARSGVRLGGTSRPLEAIAASASVLLARADLAQPGLATIWIEIPAIDVELNAAQVEAYFEEIQADPAIRKAWDPRAGKPWRERYAKFAKAFVGVGEFLKDGSWSDPIGGALEIVPESHPKQMVEPGAITVRVLKEGRALARLPLAVQSAGKREWTRTDDEGRARLALQGTGPWLIFGTQLVPPAGTEEVWQSWFTTLTVARRQ